MLYVIITNHHYMYLFLFLQGLLPLLASATSPNNEVDVLEPTQVNFGDKNDSFNLLMPALMFFLFFPPKDLLDFMVYLVWYDAII